MRCGRMESPTSQGQPCPFGWKMGNAAVETGHGFLIDQTVTLSRTITEISE